jgi:murein DD-endopeptidase MepM/ murein hydrolase activator NlpD
VRVRPASLAAALALGAMLLAGCGQYDGVHGAAAGEGQDAAASTDGLLVGERLSFDATSSSSSGPVDDAQTDAEEGPAGPAAGPRSDGPLFACPVRGRGYYMANFGAYRPGPPVHAHQGNDMFARHDTPIVAPFDGYAVATPNTLGGKAVRIYGRDGYVYNAHLSRYGLLGEVELGDVVGFVGATGNAAAGAPHDHFEWHPGNGAAVDPFPFLNEACPPAPGGGEEP